MKLPISILGEVVIFLAAVPALVAGGSCTSGTITYGSGAPYAVAGIRSVAEEAKVASAEGYQFAPQDYSSQSVVRHEYVRHGVTRYHLSLVNNEIATMSTQVAWYNKGRSLDSHPDAIFTVSATPGRTEERCVEISSSWTGQITTIQMFVG